MTVHKISEKIRMCFGSGREKQKYLATNNGTIESGYAYGETAPEAIKNLERSNASVDVEGSYFQGGTMTMDPK